MVESIDGRIDCGMVDKISGDEYYTTLASLRCPASIEGRVTMEHYYALPERFAAKDCTPAGKPAVNRTEGMTSTFAPTHTERCSGKAPLWTTGAPC